MLAERSLAERKEGLTETRFGITYYIPDIRTVFDITDLRRKSGELWGELTIRCRIDGMRTQLDGDRVRQGNFNFSSVTTRRTWAGALADMSPKEVKDRLEWGNVLEKVCQAVLDHERHGAIHGGLITGARSTVGQPWAAYPILPDHDTATLYARGGAGKTSLIDTLALSMGLGRTLVNGIRVDRPYRVVLLDWETNQRTSDNIFGLIADSYKVRIPESIWYEPMEQPFERSLPKIANVLDHHRADLLVIDSVQMAMLSSAEHSDAAESITRLHQSMRRLSAWGLLIDHVASEDMRSKRLSLKPYGSVFKSNIARHSVNLHVGDRVGETSKCYLACHKSNLMRDRWAIEGVYERSDHSLRWDFGALDFDLYDQLMSAEEEPTAETPASARLLDRVATYLAASGPASAPEVAEYMGESGNKVRSILNRGLKRERFVKGTDGRWDVING